MFLLKHAQSAQGVAWHKACGSVGNLACRTVSCGHLIRQVPSGPEGSALVIMKATMVEVEVRKLILQGFTRVLS